MRIMEYVDGCVTCLAPVNNVYKFSGRDWQAHLLPYAKDFLDLVFLFLFGVPVTQMMDLTTLQILYVTQQMRSIHALQERGKVVGT